MRVPSMTSAPTSLPSTSAPAPASRTFADALDRVRESWVASERDLRTLEAVTGPRAGSMSPAELLRLQATLYRYVERVELAAHVADRCNGAVKTVLQTQV